MKATTTVLFCTVFVLLGQCHAGWVDPDTPEKYMTASSNYADDIREFKLVSLPRMIYVHVMHSLNWVHHSIIIILWLNYYFASHVMDRYSLMSLSRRAVPLQMAQIRDGQLLTKMTVSASNLLLYLYGAVWLKMAKDMISTSEKPF